MIRILYVGGIKRDRFICEAIKAISMTDGFELLIRGKDNGDLSGCDYMLCMYNPNRKNNKFGMPNKLYTALKHSLPVIVSKNTDTAKLVNLYQCGFTCEYNSGSFIELLERIKKFKGNLSGRAKYAFEDNNWENDQKELLKIYGYNNV